MININKFVFKFEKILKYKAILEDEAVSIHNNYKKIQMDEEFKLQSILRSDSEMSEKRNETIKKTTVNNMIIYYSYLNHNSKRIQYQKDIVHKAENETKKAMSKMIQASQEKSIFEKLKERDREFFKDFIKNEEDKLLDQIVSYNNSLTSGG